MNEKWGGRNTKSNQYIRNTLEASYKHHEGWYTENEAEELFYQFCSFESFSAYSQTRVQYAKKKEERINAISNSKRSMKNGKVSGHF